MREGEKRTMRVGMAASVMIPFAICRIICDNFKEMRALAAGVEGTTKVVIVRQARKHSSR